jgi:hypothetical protein
LNFGADCLAFGWPSLRDFSVIPGSPELCAFVPAAARSVDIAVLRQVFLLFPIGSIASTGDCGLVDGAGGSGAYRAVLAPLYPLPEHPASPLSGCNQPLAPPSALFPRCSDLPFLQFQRVQKGLKLAVLLPLFCPRCGNITNSLVLFVTASLLTAVCSVLAGVVVADSNLPLTEFTTT